MVESVARLAEVQWDQVEASALPVVAVELAQVEAMIEAQLGGHKGTGGMVRAVRQLRDLPAVRDPLSPG